MVWRHKLNLLMLTLVMPTVIFGCTQNQYLKEEPAYGDLRHEQVVFVDDGTCPAGEIKKLTGGNMQRSIQRQVQCVKRPQ
jgi:hypothetical protein